MLLDTAAGHRMNPVGAGLGLLARAAGAAQLNVSTTAPRVHGFAALTAPAGALRVFLLNKYEAPQPARVALPSGLPSFVFAESLVDTADHWGTVTPTAVACAARACDVVLPALSLTVLSSET